MTTKAYYLPQSVDEAISLLAEHGPTLLVMAGGTIAMPLINEGISLPEKVMGLRQAGLNYVNRSNGVVEIGATTTITQMLTQQEIPLLQQAAHHIAGWAIRNMGTVVRSPVPHARIQGIDFSEAEKVPGFVRAFTYKDVPKNVYTILCLIGVGPDEEPVLAQNKVLYTGEQIAAIVAETEEAAMEAVSKVRLDLEELPAVLDVEEAIKPEAPILKDWGTNYFIYEGHHCRRVRFGNVNQGFEEADYIVEGRYQTSPIEHAPAETTGCVARPEADGRITVYTNTQALFFSLDNTALIL